MSETKLVKEILLALGNEPDFICWRNNTGKLADVNGRWVTYGLGVGSADIIGVLAPWGRFVAIEVKRPGAKQRPEQLNWMRAVVRNGGVYAVAHSVDEANDIIKDARTDCRLREDAVVDSATAYSAHGPTD
jgi:hypothetical protein